MYLYKYKERYFEFDFISLLVFSFHYVLTTALKGKHIVTIYELYNMKTDQKFLYLAFVSLESVFLLI